MSFIRLIVCVAGVYSMFLLWAIAQERLSEPFTSTDGSPPEPFRFPLFMTTAQSTLSALVALIYIVARKRPDEPWPVALGWRSRPRTIAAPTSNGSAKAKANGTANGHASKPPTEAEWHALLSLYARIALLLALAGPLAFTALGAGLSYPALVLGKSCKLVPVLLTNVLLYRRPVKGYKYAVVALVTAGIAAFMYFAPAKGKGKGGAGSTEWAGLAYLALNLFLDGLVNATQDTLFARHAVSGQALMLNLNFLATLISLLLGLLPLPPVPILLPTPRALVHAVEWLGRHGGWVVHWSDLHVLGKGEGPAGAVLAWAACGAVGQVFVFETLEHFGSLTLVTITLTRKLFTMLLSVALYGHALAAGQWAGAALVFGGIGVEAAVKRKEVHAKRIVQEKEKAKLKDL